MGASSEATEWVVSSIGDIDLRAELGATGGRVGWLLARLAGTVAVAGEPAMRGSVVVFNAVTSPVEAQPDKMAKVPVSASIEVPERSLGRLTKQRFGRRLKKDKAKDGVNVMREVVSRAVKRLFEVSKGKPISRSR
jgi:hypothetical protein